MRRKPSKNEQSFLKATNGKTIWTGEEIIELLEIHKDDCQGSGIKAAREIGISPSYFYRALRGQCAVGPKFCQGLGISRQWQYERND